MAVLADADRAELAAEFMREMSNKRQTIAGVTKADIRAFLNALDDFMNTNAATINAAIPQPARGALSTSVKAEGLVFVVRKRFIKGS